MSKSSAYTSGKVLWGVLDMTKAHELRTIQTQTNNLLLNNWYTALTKEKYKEVDQNFQEHSTRTKLKIAYIMNHVRVCGGAKIILEHTNQLVDRGYDVSIVCHFPKPDWKEIKARYIEVPWYLSLASAVPDNTDVIVCTVYDQVIDCYLTKKAPVVMFEQGDVYIYDFDKYNIETKQMLQKNWAIPVPIISVSSGLANALKHNFDRNSQVLHNALDQNYFYPRKDRSPKYSTKPRILFVGAEQTQFKGIAEIRAALELVRQTGREFEDIWVTPVPPTSDFKGTLVINPTQQELGEIYRSCDIYVSGSHYESFPLPPLEAMTCGCAVISTDNVGILEYGVDGYNCLLAKIHNPQSLAQRIIQLLDKPIERQRLVDNGYNTAAKFSWQQIIPRLEGLLNTAVCQWQEYKQSVLNSFSLRLESLQGDLPQHDKIEKINLVQSTMEEEWSLWLIDGEQISEQALEQLQLILVDHVDQIYSVEIHDRTESSGLHQTRFENRLFKRGVRVNSTMDLGTRLPVAILGDKYSFPVCAKVKLSVCMMVKNEEINLPRCLNSLKCLMELVPSELIVVDTGSSDATVKIAKQYTDKVFYHSWNNNFADMRNISISYAKGEWILILDADEVIEDAAELIKFLNSDQTQMFDSGAVTIKSVLAEEQESYGFGMVPRLFKREGFSYKGVVHEQPKVQQIIDLKTTFLHYGYLSTDQNLMEQKFLRNSSLLLSELEKDPANVYYRYQLSVTYKMHKDYPEALAEAIRAFELMRLKKLDPRRNLHLFHELALSYVDNGKHDDAGRICREGLKIENEHIDLHYLLAKVEGLAKQYNKAVEHYQKYLYLVDNYDRLAIRLQGTTKFLTLSRREEVYLDLALILIEQKKYNQVFSYIDKVQSNQYLKRAFDLVIKLYLDCKDFSKLFDYYQDVVLSHNDQEVEMFLTTLEAYQESLTREEWLALVKQFANGGSSYGMLNQIRFAYEFKDSSLSGRITNFVLQVKPTPIFGNLIFYMVYLKKPIASFTSQLTEGDVVTCLQRAGKRYKELNGLVLEYINGYQSDSSFGNVRSSKMLLAFLLKDDRTPEDQYEAIFKQFVKSGISYIQTMYSQHVLENELAFDMKNPEEAFLLYMSIAESKGQNNDLKYLKYLHKALDVCPAFSKGIKILMAECKARIEEKDRAKEEFAQYQRQVKGIIAKLIGDGQLDQAKNLIAQYESIVKDDQEMVALKTGLASK